MAIHPAPTPGKTLAVSHFPTAFQTVIFRLWESVPCAKLAQVLRTTEENVAKAASDMGLGGQAFLDKWHDRGYISILRAVWNLLPYEQILQLLDYTEERLKFILKEDDFLDYKLGEKCDCEPVYFRELTAEESARTSQIKEAMEKLVAPLKASGFEQPFDFYNNKRYAPLCAGTAGDVVVDSSWCLTYPDSDPLLQCMIDDFKAFAAEYGVQFAAAPAGKCIRIQLDDTITDEEYHQVQVTENAITITAGTATGALRGLYVLENQALRTGKFAFDVMDIKKKTKFKIRYIYSFSSLYADVLEQDTRISFPDELLAAYGRAGVNGVWIQGLLSQLAPHAFMPELSEGWEKRMQTLTDLCNRCARYGIKVYLYMNEPRQLPAEFYEKRPDLRGTNLKSSPHVATLCSSHPDVHQYLRDAMRSICTAAPNLGGFFLLTLSENSTTCYADGTTYEHGTNHKAVDMCPVCAKRKPEDTLADVINAMYQGVREVNDKISIIVYAWCFIKVLGEEGVKRLISMLPKDAIYLQVSENAMKFNIAGVDGLVSDYSLSLVGPSEITRTQWEIARSLDMPTMAKVQVNTSWECATAPFLPVLGNVAQHMSNLVDAGVENVMLSWTHGGYISDNLHIAASYFFEDIDNPETDPVARTLSTNYGQWADLVKKASDCFCQAFAEYPFSISNMYYGPGNTGAANLLYPQPSGMKATMTCYPFDELEKWRAQFPVDIYQQQHRKLCDKWEEGLEYIKDMPSCEFKDMAFYGYTLFASSRNHIDFIRLRDGAADKQAMRAIVENELAQTQLALEIALRNSAVGYEAANHYYCTRSAFAEKIVQCDYLLRLYED